MNNEAENKEPSSNFKFSAAVAEFGMLLLSSSESRMGSTLAALLQLAKDAIGEDQYGYRAEFIKLVEAYQQMTEQKGGQQ
jgi:Ca-activated chloride channel family protein